MSDLPAGPAPPRRAGDLVLRPWTRTDRDAWLALFADPAVVRWMGDGVVRPERDAEVFERLLTLALGPEEAFAFVYAAELAGDVVGHAELKRTQHTSEREWEIVYALAPRAWGRGLGSALARWAIDTAHAHGRRLVATVSPQNAASLRILTRLGLRVTEQLDAGETLLLRE